MGSFLRRHRARILVYGLLLVAIPAAWYLRTSISTLIQKGEWRWPKTAAAVVREHEPRVREKYAPVLEAAGGTWPPRRLVLLGMKTEMRLEAWDESAWPPIFIGAWPVLAGSGVGHKRKRGDGQVPEGLYTLTNLNPDSLYHLSIRVDYPSDDDRAHGAGDLGDDIYVHGRDASIGCLAIGDPAIEEVFTLAALARSRRIVISPVDFRTGAVAPDPGEAFLRDRYAAIAKELERFVTERHRTVR